MLVAIQESLEHRPAGLALDVRWACLGSGSCPQGASVCLPEGGPHQVGGGGVGGLCLAWARGRQGGSPLAPWTSSHLGRVPHAATGVGVSVDSVQGMPRWWWEHEKGLPWTKIDGDFPLFFPPLFLFPLSAPPSPPTPPPPLSPHSLGRNRSR